MAVPTPGSNPSPISLGALEYAAVAFLGAFAGALAVVGDSVPHAAEIGGVAAAAALGYHAYQSS